VIGCQRVSEGCRHCWAVGMAWRHQHNPSQARYHGLTRAAAHGPEWTGEVRFVPEVLAAPLGWRRPRRIAVSPMGDLFRGTDEEIAAVFGVMAACPQHAFLLLTKQVERAVQWFAWHEGASGAVANAYAAVYVARELGVQGGWWPRGFNPEAYVRPWPLPNVHIGFSAENQAAFNARWPWMASLADAGWNTWASLEPLLGPIDMTRVEVIRPEGSMPGAWMNALTGHVIGPDDMMPGRLRHVVAGGESGPGARPMHPDWARSLRNQCAAAGVPYCHKQNGEWADVGDAHALAEQGMHARDNERALNLAGGHGFHGEAPRRMRRVGKKAAGRELDGVVHDAFPEPRP